MKNTIKPLKLYVVGETSPNPQDWSIWSELSIVIAESAEEATRLAGSVPATEIPMGIPQVLVTMPEPNWGDDT